MLNRENKFSEIMKKYLCLPCGYIYDPAEGDPENGIFPGTPFEDLPEDWTCPACGVGKEHFEEIQILNLFLDQAKFSCRFKKYSYLCIPNPTWCPQFSWLERQIVVLNVMGSNPIGHPTKEKTFPVFSFLFPSKISNGVNMLFFCIKAQS